MSTEKPPQLAEAETESPYILIDESGVRHVLLSTTCEGPYASAEVTVLLAAFDASTIAPAVVLHRLYEKNQTPDSGPRAGNSHSDA